MENLEQIINKLQNKLVLCLNIGSKVEIPYGKVYDSKHRVYISCVTITDNNSIFCLSNGDNNYWCDFNSLNTEDKADVLVYIIAYLSEQT